MLAYYIAYLLMLFAGIWRMMMKKGLERKKSRKLFCILFACIWIVLLGLRHPSMGVDLGYNADTIGYLAAYLIIGEWTWAQVLTEPMLNYEVGYTVFNKLLNYLSDDYQLLLFVCALLSIAPVVWWIYQNSKYPMLSAFIYLGLSCFMINYSGLRQGIAIAFTTVASDMIWRKKPVWFVILVVLGSFFHSSALFFLVAYPLYQIKLSRLWSAVSMVLPPVVFLFRVPLFTVLSKLFKENARVDNNGAVTLFLVFWAIYAFAAIFEHAEDPKELGIRNLYLMACLCQAFGGVYNTAIRVGYYFMIFSALLLPKLIENEDKKTKEGLAHRSAMLMYLPILVCFFAFGLYALSHGSWAMSNPHLFFWQEKIELELFNG